MHNVFTKEVNKIALSSNDNKIIQSIDSIGTYAYLVIKTEEIKCNNIIKNTKIINFDDVPKENIKENNLNWPQIPDHTSKMLIIACYGSCKTNSLVNLISHVTT